MANVPITPRRSTTRRFHTLPDTWDAARVAAAMREWAREAGAPPKTYEWCPASARAAGLIDAGETKWEREHPRWPGNTTVYRYFGSWSAALEAAGINTDHVPRPDGTLAERVATAKRLRAAGESVRSISSVAKHVERVAWLQERSAAAGSLLQLSERTDREVRGLVVTGREAMAPFIDDIPFEIVPIKQLPAFLAASTKK